MRRGLVAVGGRAGNGAGLRMLAGTVIALGGLGAEAGLGNKRGSLVSGGAVDPLAGVCVRRALSIRRRCAAAAPSPRALGLAVRRRVAARTLGALVGRPDRAEPRRDPDLRREEESQ